MRNYKLFTNQKKNIGNLIIRDDFSQITINLSSEFKEDYKPVFERIVDTLNKDGNFNVQLNNWIIENTSKDFWVAFKQTILTYLPILVVKT